MDEKFGEPGAKPRLEWVSVDEITVDRNYQRDLRPRRISQILKDFNWSRFEPVMLAEKNGGYNVYDGQHRVEAAKLHPLVDKIPALISTIANMRDEAAAFIDVNRNRTAVSSIEKYHAGIEAGDPDMMAVCSVVGEAGCEIAQFQGDIGTNKTNAVVAVSRAIGTNGDQPVVAALTTLREAWPEDKNALMGVLINAISGIFRNNKTISKPRMVDILAAMSRKELAGDAETMRKISGGTAEANIRRVIVAKYNQGQRTNQIEFGGRQ